VDILSTCYGALWFSVLSKYIYNFIRQMLGISEFWVLLFCCFFIAKM